ncbi:hypothetical protein [Pedobacter deserti]|uniref:hypothetical protein n=1 Tax=Pedobacter deserti TaxID=2817382 RepID=UPI00210BE64E|nr:hypothetical protein [Pedobacter sp. SYSU D00382]
MSNYRNPHIKENERRYNFVPHLKFKRVKVISRGRIRQQLRASLSPEEIIAGRNLYSVI